MPIRFEPWITREMARNNPEDLHVFGDNLQRSGFGGQAKELRGEPNAVGIPTKRAPHMGPGAFFGDWPRDIEEFKEAAAPAFARLHSHLLAGGTVIWPADGIGTGLADLERRAPRIWDSLQRALDRLKEIP